MFGELLIIREKFSFGRKTPPNVSFATFLNQTPVFHFYKTKLQFCHLSKTKLQCCHLLLNLNFSSGAIHHHFVYHNITINVRNLCRKERNCILLPALLTAQVFFLYYPVLCHLEQEKNPFFPKKGKGGRQPNPKKGKGGRPINKAKQGY